MKKTGFFYAKKAIFILCLIWLALLNEAVSLNVSRIKEEAQAVADSAQEKQAKLAADSAQEKQEKLAADSTQEEQTKPVEDVDRDETVRVLIRNTDQQSYYHSAVVLTYQGEERTYTTDSQELKEGSVVLSAEEGIAVSSVERQEGTPVYRGCIEIIAEDEGLLLINELPVEQYLEGVVPSEMPSSYPAEALKAQAVCARTYAWKQIQEKRLEEYGADVDDSVNFQVYQNIFPQESTTNAVSETKGEVICQDKELIEAYYFSTSAGVTSTDEVWGAKEAASYLKSVPCAFDAQEPWSAWKVEIPWDQLQTNARKYTDPEAALKSIQITRKNQSGAVIGLWVTTDRGSFSLAEEYDIREFLSPSGCTIYGKDGAVMTGDALLLSAYFSMELYPGEKVCISGKGYGHGVGMSQNGAKAMAEQGYTYREILDYFFQDIEILQAEQVSG